MKTTLLPIPDVLLIEPRVFTDSRGEFMESFHQSHYEVAIGRFVHGNHGRSSIGHTMADCRAAGAVCERRARSAIGASGNL